MSSPEVPVLVLDGSLKVPASRMPDTYPTTQQMNDAITAAITAAGGVGGGSGGVAGSVSWANITNRPGVELVVKMPGGVAKSRPSVVGTDDVVVFQSPTPPAIGGTNARPGDYWDLVNI